MLRDDIKKILGICNEDFDGIIDGYIASAKKDLEVVGVVVRDDDSLTNTAIMTYVCGFIDEEKAELYRNSYVLQKDALRRYVSYQQS